MVRETENPNAAATAFGAEIRNEVAGGRGINDRAPARNDQNATHWSTQRDRFRFFRWAELGALPGLAWLVKGVIASGAFSICVGASGSGKTFVAIDIAACVARGVPWCGRKVTQGAVLFIAAEGGRGIVRRFAAYAEHYKLDTSNIPLEVLPQAIDLRSPTADIDELVRSVQSAHHNRSALIVVDTLNCAIAGGDENSPVDMGQLIRNCHRLQEETGAHVMLVHHLGKDAGKGARGHSSLKAAVDTALDVKFKGSTIHVVIAKQRDGESGDEFRFELQIVELGEDEDGTRITSCVVKAANGAHAVSEAKLSTGARKVLQALRAALQPISNMPPDAAAGLPPQVTSAATEDAWRDQAYVMGISNGGQRAQQLAFQRAKEALQERGLVAIKGEYAYLPKPQ
jgi:AAA domain